MCELRATFKVQCYSQSIVQFLKKYFCFIELLLIIWLPEIAAGVERSFIFDPEILLSCFQKFPWVESAD